jgi:hypothetical protein
MCFFKNTCFPLRLFHPLGREKEKRLEVVPKKKKINFLVKMKGLSQEMEAHTTQWNTNKVLSWHFS